ncbi:LysR family transcriptional regulator [Thioalkalivibrio sulfidiphilus]|uniref:LysR family transcriptional regulator n=1 Tax=Thioalkalivibrio sulfidiphilus TaxID=1033854 RepID=UPI003B331A32
MDTDQIRTFLAVAAYGSFLEAAERLHVTQSTVSARIQRLEADLGNRLFVRNRSGASLTAAGRRFLRHAKSLLLTLEQARHDVGLPSRFRASITVGARIALWEGFLPQWLGRFRASAPDVSVRSEIGFEEDLMRRLVEGTLDVGLMYTPRHSPGLVVERLFDETLVLYDTDPGATGPGEDYVHVDWGPAFHAQHAQHYPDVERPALHANIGWLGVQIILCNGGSCFLPERMARPLIEAGRLFPVPGSPRLSLPAYMVFPRDSESPVLSQVLDGLRALAAEQG